MKNKCRKNSMSDKYTYNTQYLYIYYFLNCNIFTNNERTSLFEGGSVKNILGGI